MIALSWAQPLVENALFKDIGRIFQPVFDLFATILALIYGVIPNYAVAIALLTIVIMGALTPLTVKSTKSMIAMQRMQPEIKKLQQKYKGAENREQLNQELMRLYKEEGINPAGGCIPMLLQMPFLIVLYDCIKGITNTGTYNAHRVCQATIVAGHEVCALPRYIPHNSAMYHNLVQHPGQMVAFGVNLALKPFSHHPGGWPQAVPYFVLVAIAVGLQFFQMRQMNSRNPQAAQANPQMQTMQKIMPIFFAYIYFIIPAAVVIYMIVSTMIRIATQDVIFRTGIVQPAGERVIPGKSKEIPAKSQAVPPAKKSLPPGAAAAGTATGPAGNGNGKNGAPTRGPAAAGGKAGGSGRTPPGKSGPPAKGARKAASPPTASGGNGNGTEPDPAADGTSAARQQNRSKAKRTRKAR